MRRRMSFWIIGMLLSLLPTTAFSSDGLTFNDARIEGLAYSDLPLTILIDVTNNGAEDYYGWWSVGNKMEWENAHAVEIKAGDTKEVAFETIIAQAGDVKLSVFDNNNDLPIYTFTIHLEKGLPKISGSVQLFLEEDSEGNRYISSNFGGFNIYVTATITNDEEVDIPTAGYKDSYLKAVLIPQIGNAPVTVSFSGIPDVIRSGESITASGNIICVGMPEEGQEYGVEIRYMDIVIATSEPFTFRSSINTYWTADGSKKRLSVVDGNTLKVPAEALAVDLRGIYNDDTVYKIDVSEANPNCLYYLGFLDYVPKGFTSETNIIRSGEASTVVIDSNYDYFCPIPFKAKSALFTYTPVSESMGPASPVMSQKMSGLICLPFSVQKAWLLGANEGMHPESPFYNDDFKMAVLSTGDQESIVFIYQPGLVPNCNNCYLIYDLKPSPVVFYAEDVAIPEFSPQVWEAGGYSFHKSWISKTAEDYTYSWNCDKSSICRNEEGTLIRPFNVFIDKWDAAEGTYDKTGPVELPFSIIVTGESTDTESLRRTPDDKTIYTLYGQRVGTATYTDGRLNTEGLKPGLYLVGGKKVVIK